MSIFTIMSIPGRPSMALRLATASCCFLLLQGSLPCAEAQPRQPPSLATEVIVKSPADTDTELQAICLFLSDPSNTLHGSLVEMNQKLGGLLDRIRTPARFGGELGETLLIVPGAGSLSARRLLIVGLGDSRTFTPARMNLVGEVVFGEANRLHVTHPFFAPTILDGGVTGFSTGEVAEQFMRGFLRARDLEFDLKAQGVSAGESVESLSFLAGAAHAADTQAGIKKAVDAKKPHP
jgi:hypothetical protein